MSDRPEEQPGQDQAGAAREDGPQDGAGAEPRPDPQARAEEAGGNGTSQDVGAELDTLRERYLRLAAEYENYRKRTDRERSESVPRAQAQIVERLLEPLDDLQRVAHFSAGTTSVEVLLEGVQMVERKLLRVLEGMGLEQIDARGRPFDPSLHEALMTVPAQERDEDESVGEVLQAGYQFKGILLRPARVQVKKYEG